MATSELGGNFVAKGTILKDWRESLVVANPSVEAKAVMERLLVVQDCDLQGQLLGDLASNSEDGLANNIKLYVRDNASDSTQMPPALRLHFTKQASAAGITDTELRGTEVTSYYVPPVEAIADPFPFYGARQAPWAMRGGWLEFNQGCEIELNFNFNLGLDVPDTDLTTVLWRLSNTGSNRFVVVTPVIELEGSLTTGSSARIPLPAVSFYPENLTSRTKITLAGKLRLSALQSSFTLGRIERLRMVLSRSPFSASSAGGVRDVVSLHKQSVANTIDTSNFLEVIEL